VFKPDGAAFGVVDLQLAIDDLGRSTGLLLGDPIGHVFEPILKQYFTELVG
jgi:hypothetical protein